MAELPGQLTPQAKYPKSREIYYNLSPFMGIILPGDTQLSCVMASITNEYRENAEECLGWARTARSDKERGIFLQMAQAWTEAATRRERRYSVMHAELERCAPPAS